MGAAQTGVAGYIAAAAAARRRTAPRTDLRLPGRDGSHRSVPTGGASPSGTQGCGRATPRCARCPGRR